MLKTYNYKKNQNYRFIYFSNIHQKAENKDDLLKFCNHKANKISESAELDEVTQVERDRDYKHEAVCRAKRKVKELIRHNFSDRLKLLTLTYGEVCESREQVLVDIKNMCKRYKCALGMELRYVATLEWQKKRHCLHVHMLVDTPFVDAKRWAELYWQKGFIRINTIAYGKAKSNCFRTVTYVLKYIEKDAESCDYYTHLYFRSKNWNTDLTVEYFDDVNEEVLKRFSKNPLYCDKLEMTRFFFESHDGYIINIIDLYPSDHKLE